MPQQGVALSGLEIYRTIRVQGFTPLAKTLRPCRANATGAIATVPTHARARAGFTLVELLVVIVIMAVLIALVVPSLARVRRSTKRTICLTNVKSLMTAVQAYAVEHDGSIPYGPTAPPPTPSNLYPITGMVTSQLSLSTGQPIGLGLMLRHHLGRSAEILFCPGADNRIDAKRELSKVGKSQVIHSYFYRHGSNTLKTRNQPIDTWDDRTHLENLGTNSKGHRIRALVVDQNYLTETPLPAYGIIVRTNHKTKRVNAGFDDGHAETRHNPDGKYSVDVGRFPFYGPDKILGVFEKLDQP